MTPAPTQGRAEQRRAWQRERRAAARRHHPDLGGSAEDLVRALEAVDRAHGVPRGPVPPRAEVTVRRTTRGRMRAWRRRVHLRLAGLGTRRRPSRPHTPARRRNP